MRLNLLLTQSRMNVEPSRQPAAVQTKKQNQPTTKTTPPTVVNRISNYDFRARKFQKPPIGTSEKKRCIVLLVAHTKARKYTGENRLHQQETHWAPELSLYRAYFVPGGMDPFGLCTCCCCPTKIGLTDIEFVELKGPIPNSLFGFKFKVEWDLERVEARSELPDCTVEWFECPSRGGSLGQKPNEWNSIPSDLHGIVIDFKQPEPCDGKASGFWQDTPSIFNSAPIGGVGLDSISIKFAVRVNGGEGCGCSKTVLFTLRSKVVKHNPFGPPTIAPDPPVFIDGVDKGGPAGCTSGNIPWGDK